MKNEDNDLMYDKDKVFILPIKDDGKPLKFVFEELPCPIHPEYRCKHSKFVNTEDLNFELQCEFRVCDRFMTIKSE